MRVFKDGKNRGRSEYDSYSLWNDDLTYARCIDTNSDWIEIGKILKAIGAHVIEEHIDKTSIERQSSITKEITVYFRPLPNTEDDLKDRFDRFDRKVFLYFIEININDLPEKFRKNLTFSEIQQIFQKQI